MAEVSTGSAGGAASAGQSGSKAEPGSAVARAGEQRGWVADREGRDVDR